jgi:hypothetical protein
MGPEMRDTESELDELFVAYRNACPEPEAGINFRREMWARIDSRRTFSFVFTQYARLGAAVAALLCVFLLVLTQLTGGRVQSAPASTYADALAADQTAEQTYYAETVRATPDYDAVGVGEGSRP